MNNKQTALCEKGLGHVARALDALDTVEFIGSDDSEVIYRIVQQLYEIKETLMNLRPPR